MQSTMLRGSNRLAVSGGAGRLPYRARAVASLPRGSRTLHVTQCRFGGSSPSLRGQPEIADRVLALLPYALPFLNAFTYGRYLFYMYPALKACIKPIVPAVAAFHAIPFGSMLAFFGIYLGIVNNKSMSRFVRFNAMQAMLLDILLVLPRLLESVFTPPSSGWAVQAYAHSQSFVWVFITSWVVFAVANCIMGQWGRIPFVGEAADQQIR